LSVVSAGSDLIEGSWNACETREGASNSSLEFLSIRTAIRFCRVNCLGHLGIWASTFGWISTEQLYGRSRIRPPQIRSEFRRGLFREGFQRARVGIIPWSGHRLP
jgi:hypothetical protein